MWAIIAIPDFPILAKYEKGKWETPDPLTTEYLELLTEQFIDEVHSASPHPEVDLALLIAEQVDGELIAQSDPLPSRKDRIY